MLAAEHFTLHPQQGLGLPARGRFSEGIAGSESDSDSEPDVEVTTLGCRSGRGHL